MTELTSLKGIGEKTAGALSRLGILSAENLLFYFPRDYELYDSPTPVCALKKGRIGTVEGMLEKDAALNRFQGMVIVNAWISDIGGKLQLSWFRLPYLASTLKSGAHFVFRGRVYEKNGRLVMNQAKLYRPEEYHTKYEGHMLPVYSCGKGISTRTIMKAVAEAIGTVGNLPDPLDEEIRLRFRLMDESEAVKRIHFPRSEGELLDARRRLAFDEFLAFIISGALIKRRSLLEESAYRCRPAFQLLRFISSLPFELTEGQQKVYREVIKDMSSGTPMLRLVEGDVGSGKTVLAFLAMMNAVYNGFQAALMAPTEVLARQHYEKLKDILERNGDKMEPVLLTGSMTAREKKETYGKIASGEASLVIGTHALIQEGVTFRKLGLVVTDEQHRFGVLQRETLKEKGGMPHTLMLSATPIPRTLALLLYGDLDISVLDVLPSGRKPIKNCVVGPGSRGTAYKFILEQLAASHQAYVICPAVEAGEEDGEEGEGDMKGQQTQLCNVRDYAALLTEKLGDKARVAVLHGRMKPAEKEAVMAAFKARETDVLVSTTVVEVGVDVPNATVIMIENAERFGLSELHQLRGRVGRGADQSYCIMVNTSDTEKAAERLEIINSTNDGFKIASEDLRLRGPGDMLGIRQSGDMNFRMADIYADREALAQAREAAGMILEKDPLLENQRYAGLKENVSRLML